MPQATVETKIGLSFNFDIAITVNGERVQIGEPTIEVQQSQPETAQPPKTKKKKQPTGEVWEQLDLLDPPAVNPVSNVVGVLVGQEVLFEIEDEPIKAKDTRKKKPKQKAKADYTPEPLPFDNKVKASPGTSAGGATSAIITPQTPIDQRLEIAIMSERNARLMELDTAVGELRSREAQADRVKQKKARMTPWELAVMKRNAELYRAESRIALQSACGECALAATCKIKDNLPKWVRNHLFATDDGMAKHDEKFGKNSKVRPGMESREAWRRRLLEDPEAPCLPPA